MGVSSHKYSENGYFHDIGIHSENGYAVEGQWVMKTLSTIMKELNHTGVSILEQMDKSDYLNSIC
jgi:hypothetical protein